MKINYIKIIFYKIISKINMKVLNFISILCKKINRFNNTHIKKTLMPIFLVAYKKINISRYLNRFNKIIWIFWWQGYNESTPVIVRRCIDSIFRHSGDFKVVLVTKYNIRKYTNIPRYIYKKLTNGIIDFTHFSDILRYNLLLNNGGLWIDSTMYCTSDLSSKDFTHNNLFTTVGAENKYDLWVSGKWTVSLIGGFEDNELFQFMNYFYKIYWKYNDKLINYNLIDYALWFAYKHNIGNFKGSIDNIYSYNNIDKFKLVNILNEKYNSELYKKITSNTQLFKLTYKRTFNNKGDTFYHRLINGKL